MKLKTDDITGATPHVYRIVGPGLKEKPAGIGTEVLSERLDVNRPKPKIKGEYRREVSFNDVRNNVLG